MKAIKTLGAWGILLMLFGPHAFAAPTQPWGLLDLSEYDQYRESILYLYGRGIVQGYGDGNFYPDRPINRAEALKIILEYTANETINNDIAAEPARDETISVESSPTSIPFSDVPDNAWYTPYIRTAYQNGIISGYPDGTFHPGQTIKLSEALKIIIKALGEPWPNENTRLEIDPALDVPAHEWYAPYAQFGLDHKMIRADADGNLHMESLMSRGRWAELIHRWANESKFSGQMEFGTATWYAGRFEGDATANGEIFTQEQLTAAHRTLPFGAIVRVTDPLSGKSVDVRINDRGPYTDSIIDLSSSAFEALAPLSRGVIKVEVEIIYP